VGGETRFAALRTGAGWTAEYAVPLAQLGIQADRIDHLNFNLGIRKARANEWLAWVGTSAGRRRTTPATAAPQVVQNGGFDEPDGNGARQWRWFGEGTAARATLATEGADGTPCLQLEADVPQERGVGAMQLVAMPTAGTYYLALQLRGRNLRTEADGGVQVSVRYLPMEGSGRSRSAGEQRLVSRLSPLWERLELPVTIPPDTAAMTVTIQLRNATGTAWVDQVSLRQVAGD